MSSHSIFVSSDVKGERVIYTSSSFAKQNLIYLQEIGISNYVQPHTSKRGNQSSYLFFLVLSGSGSVEYRNTTYILNKNDCLFINCSSPYTLSSYEDLWKLAWIHLDGPNMYAIHEKFIERCAAPCFSAENPTDFLSLHHDIFDLSTSSYYVRDMLITEKLTNLITMLMKKCWKLGKNQAVSKNIKDISEIRKYLDQHFLELIKLDEISSRFYINKFYLTRRFKEAYGITMQQFILEKRITVAKELLRFSDLCISEIATQSGFNDANYFSRAFKKIEHKSPTQFQKEWTASNYYSK